MQSSLNSGSVGMVFPAKLGAREKLVTYGVGFGVGLGLPMLLGGLFAFSFGQSMLLLLPAPFLFALGLAAGFRPLCFVVNWDELEIRRPLGSFTIPFEEITSVHRPAGGPSGAIFRLVAVSGIFGEFGIYWNRNWGAFRLFVSDHNNKVALSMANGSRVIISPDSPSPFIRTLLSASALNGHIIDDHSI